MSKVALISVSNRDKLDSFARHLVGCGYTLLGTSGTRAFLAELDIPCESIEEYTGQKEILEGRVKTLHPKIHGGLLAKKEKPEHLAQLGEQGILPIDIAIVNLYPFTDGLKTDAAKDPKKMIELIDIGGPTMIRAAAKNHHSILPLIDPNDYERVMPFITADPVPHTVPEDLRRSLAVKVFSWLADYNLQIAKYLSQIASESPAAPRVEGQLQFSPIEGMILSKEQELRYGENPHQKAALYRSVTQGDRVWTQLQGKELSYNNLLDFDSALRLMRNLPSTQPVAAILKHLNPCGVAAGDTQLEALKRAKWCDPRSHFGGILVFNREVDEASAAEVAEDFAEIVVAPGFSSAALEIFKRKKNLRVMQAEISQSSRIEMRSIEGGVLLQESDWLISRPEDAELVSDRAVSEQEYRDVGLAWQICGHVKSNAVVVLKEGMLIGVGAGQMSRIDSTELALSKARLHQHNVAGAVAASDAFFPFPDSLELLAEHGVTVVIAPRGSRADDQVIASAKRLGVSLLFAADRHFRH